jgi:hypothetical protein
MIVFELKCSKNHRFEGWFASGEDFESQRRSGLLECPTCGTPSVSKLLTAKIRKAAEGPKDKATPAPAGGKQERVVAALDPKQMLALMDHLMSTAEDVGGGFAEEARKIHRKEAPERSIRGRASEAEVEELLDEGISVMPLPVPPQEEWH